MPVKADGKRRRMLVVGASGGIGSAVMSEAAALGWECIGADRHSEVAIDLSDAAGLEPRLADLFGSRGPFDAVVFAAGVCPVVPLGSVTAESLARTMQVNCMSFVLLVKAYAAHGAGADGGVVVAVSSVSANEGWAGGAEYCASKGALSSVARALDVELKPKGISVKAVEPGHVLTDMFRRGAGRMGVPESSAQAPGELAREIVAMAESLTPGGMGVAI